MNIPPRPGRLSTRTTASLVLLGALVMGVLNQGLSIMSVDSAWQQVVKGLVLLAAVAFDVINRRRSGTS